MKTEEPVLTKKSSTIVDDDIDDLDLDLDGMNIDDNIDTSVSIYFIY